MKQMDIGKINKVLVVMLGGIGNMILLMPALRALREELPGKEIILMTGEPEVERIAGAHNLFDKVVLHDRRVKQSLLNKIQFIKSVRDEKIDLAIVSSGTNAFLGSLFTFLMGIPNRVGEDINGRGFLYTVKSNYDENENELDGTLRLLKATGLRAENRDTFLSVLEGDKEKVDQFLLENGIAQTDLLIGMHTGSGLKQRDEKRWPKERFARLGDELINRHNAKIVLTGSSGEADLTKEISGLIKGSVFSAAGKMDITETAALIKRCRLFISNDSGVAHIAAALGVPLVVLFGPTDIKRICPQGKNVYVVKKDLVEDDNGLVAKVKRNDSLKDIEVEDVLNVTENLIKNEKTEMAKTLSKGSKIKALHIITRLDAGGSSTNTLETVVRLDRDKYDVTLIIGKTFDPHAEVERFVKEHNIKCIVIDILRRNIHPLKDVRSFFRLLKIIWKGQFDIVHTHSSKAGILGRWAAWLARVPIIIHTPHGHIFYGYYGKDLTQVFVLMERITAKITDKIITLTARGKEEHVQFNIANVDKFLPIYSGIDINYFSNPKVSSGEKRKELGIPLDSVVFGAVARLDPVKGNDFLIEAMAQVVKQFSNARLIIAGDGSQRGLLEGRIKELGIEENVLLLGFRKDIPEILQMIDVFVLASLNEGMGRVILEAMACEKPIVATRVGGIPELVEHGKQGFLVEPAEPSSLSQAMLELAVDGEKRKFFGTNGKRKVSEMFSIEKMIKDIEALYEDLLESKK